MRGCHGFPGASVLQRTHVLLLLFSGRAISPTVTPETVVGAAPLARMGQKRDMSAQTHVLLVRSELPVSRARCAKTQTPHLVTLARTSYDGSL